MTRQKQKHHHSQEIKDIMQKVPHWATTWGTISLISLLIIIIIACSIINIPINKRLNIVLVLANSPIYFTHQEGVTIKPIEHPTKIVQGDTLFKNDETNSYFIAPYSGTIIGVNYLSKIKADTISILIPDVVSYNLVGKIPLKFKDHMKLGSKITININSPSLKEDITVWGVIKEISPVALDEEISFYGHIENKSSLLLKQSFMYSPRINGFYEITLSDNTIFNMLISRSRQSSM